MQLNRHMLHYFIKQAILMLGLVCCPLFASATTDHASDPNKAHTPDTPPRVSTADQVQISTNYGNIVIDLNTEKAPVSVENFLTYVKQGFYTDTLFHRVIPGFMIQGGGLTQDMTKKNTQAPIKNEASNGLLNQRGTVAMARTNAPDSATSQFFINLTDNTFLNPNPRNPGYAVFGKVVQGMDVVDNIAKVPTTTRQGRADVPKEPVIILKATILDTRSPEKTDKTSKSGPDESGPDIKEP